MSDVMVLMVLMSESSRSEVREISTFIEFSRLTDHMTRVTETSVRIHEALNGETWIRLIELL